MYVEANAVVFDDLTSLTRIEFVTLRRFNVALERYSSSTLCLAANMTSIQAQPPCHRSISSPNWMRSRESSPSGATYGLSCIFEVPPSKTPATDEHGQVLVIPNKNRPIYVNIMTK